MITKSKNRSRGLTLVEMLIVLAIIGVLTAVALPSFMRMGLFSHDVPRDNARLLYTLMKAAQVYAQTYRVDTALAYDITKIDDSVTANLKVPVIDGVALVRKLRPEDQDYAAYRGKYVPVKDEQGVFTLFKSGGVVLLDTSARLDKAGVVGIEVIDEDNSSIVPSPYPRNAPGLPYSLKSLKVELNYPEETGLSPDAFAAHVFKPNGTITSLDGARKWLEMVPSPDAQPVERFIDDANSVPVPPYNVELYPTMGRLKISSGA